MMKHAKAPERIMSRLAACALIAVMALSPGPLSAADKDTESKLRQVEKELKARKDRSKNLKSKADRLGRDAQILRRSLIGATASVQKREDEVNRIERRLAALSAEETAKSKDLSRRRDALADTLGTLARLSRHPPEALIASPAPPVDMVRGSIVLAAVVPEMERRANTLKAELTALRGLRREIANRRARLASANEGLNKERQALDRLLRRTDRRRHLALAENDKEQSRMSRLAATAKDLRALLQKIEADARSRRQMASLPPPPASTTPFSSEQGRLPLPARGRIVSRFGQRNKSGTHAMGIVIATREGAPVVAPHDGRVVYAGLFRSYGLLLIIDHGEGYHTLIAGMSRIDGVVGQWLLAGEPVGHMGSGVEGKSGNGSIFGGNPIIGGQSQALYLELRRNNEPINPLPWLAASERKVSG